MKAKKWIFISTLIVGCIIVFNFLFLVLFDIYGVSNPLSTKHHSAIQQRFLIVEYMMKNLKKYDSLLFGSSRVQFINPLHIKNTKTYNMTVAEGIPHEHLLNLKLLVKKEMKLKHILIGLDDFSYQVPFVSHQNSPELKAHYLATNTSKFNFYKTYYFRKPNKKDFIHIKNTYNDTKPWDRHHEIIFNQKDSFTNAKYDKTDVNSSVFNIPTLYNGNEISDTIQDIKEIVKICKENNIKLIFFINPIHHTTYKHSNLDRLSKFKKELSLITPYYDFSIQNEISKNNKYWLETSHYTLEVGDMILNRIYDNNTSIKDFGIYMPKSLKEKTN